MFKSIRTRCYSRTLYFFSFFLVSFLQYIKNKWQLHNNQNPKREVSMLSLLLRARSLTLTIEFFELIFYGVWLGISVLSIFFFVKCFSIYFYGFYSGVLCVDFLVICGFWTGLVAWFSCDVLGFLLKVVEEGDCGRHLLPVFSLIRKKKRTLDSHIEGCVVIFIQTQLLSFLFACM